MVHSHGLVYTNLANSAPQVYHLLMLATGQVRIMNAYSWYIYGVIGGQYKHFQARSGSLILGKSGYLAGEGDTNQC